MVEVGMRRAAAGARVVEVGGGVGKRERVWGEREVGGTGGWVGVGDRGVPEARRVPKAKQVPKAPHGLGGAPHGWQACAGASAS